MASVRITEQVTSSVAGSRVDRDKGVIFGALICGATSDNARDYPWRGPLGKSIAAYEGKHVYADHGREPTLSRKIGWFENVKPGPDGRPRGDFHILKSHPLAESVFEAAERNPSLYGFSHVAMCQTRREKGREVVEAINSVESIDLVANPATTTSIFESTSGSPAVKISLKQFVETRGPTWGPKRWAAATKLVEDLGDMGDTPVMDAPAADADPGDLKQALLAALAPMLDDAFDTGNADKAVSALKDFIKLHAKHTGGDTAGDSGGVDDNPATPESKKPVNPWDVLRECRKAGFEPTESQLEMLAGQCDPAKRTTFIAESKAQLDAAKKTTEAVSRPTSDRRTTESVVSAKPASSGEEFLKRVMG